MPPPLCVACASFSGPLRSSRHRDQGFGSAFWEYQRCQIRWCSLSLFPPQLLFLRKAQGRALKRTSAPTYHACVRQVSLPSTKARTRVLKTQSKTITTGRLQLARRAFWQCRQRFTHKRAQDCRQAFMLRLPFETSVRRRFCHIITADSFSPPLSYVFWFLQAVFHWPLKGACREENASEAEQRRTR